ncbi:hypothetical protein U1Q18_032939 [Sarracenia purpurea var. burkii]
MKLTPDIVKAALYGPASAKIPPQINLAAATPAPQLNAVAPAPTPHMHPIAPSASQNLSFRGQVPPNTSMNQQYFPSHQSMRPPLPPSASNASRPPQGVAIPGLSSGGTVGGRSLPVSNSSLLTGAPHVPNQAISPSISSAAAKPQDPLSSPSLPFAIDSKTSVGSGNGFASDPVCGGDVFSATQSIQSIMLQQLL